MKKLLSILVSVLALLTISLPAFADMGAPTVDPYMAYVGPNGVTAEDWWSDQGNVRIVELEAGTKVEVYEFETSLKLFPEEGSYFINDKSDKVYVIDTEVDQLENLFKENTVVPKNYGSYLSETEKGRITADGGLFIRMGPSIKYPKRGSIPKNKIVKYNYIWNDSWIYVNYNGTEGWISLEYVSSDLSTTTKTIESNSDIASDVTKQNDVNIDIEIEKKDEPIIYSEKVSHQSSVAREVIICILLGAIIALTAVVILIIVSKQKNINNQTSCSKNDFYNNNNYWQ